MEHPCHQCGATVEEGTPFCQQCGAPQIRVEADAGATPPLPPGTPGQLQPPAQPVFLTPGPAAPARIEWSQALPGTLIAGLLLALSWVIPRASLVCLWMIVAGVLAVALYRRRSRVPVTPGMGARLGAVTGLVGFVIYAVLVSLAGLVMKGQLRGMLSAALQQAASANPNPAVREAVQRLSTPEGMALLFTLMMVIMLAAFLVFSAIGGALGAALFRPREK